MHPKHYALWLWDHCIYHIFEYHIFQYPVFRFAKKSEKLDINKEADDFKENL